MAKEVIGDLIASAPPVSVGTLMFFGYPLSQWVLILTAIYTTLLIVKVSVWLWDRFVNKKDDGSIE